MSRSRTAVTVLLGSLLAASLVPASAPAWAVDHTVSTQALQGGRLYSATGVAWGGLFFMNMAATQAVNLTTNTFGSDTDGTTRYKSEEPSLSLTGRMAFASNRTGSWRVYVASADGSKVRQLTKGDRSIPDDRRPVISPDGTQVAFISRRSPDPDTAMAQSTDIWVVGTNGRNLRRLTLPESDSRGTSTIRAVDWNEDGTRLAYRGTRLITEATGPVMREVLGFIDIDGSGESKIRIDDCAGGSVVDWVGSSVLYSLGGAVQGCYPTKYLVWDESTSQTRTLEHEQLQGASDGAGSARLSADQRSVIYTYLTTTSDVAVARIATDGSDRTVTTTRAIAPGVWLWWSASAFPRIRNYVIKPRKVTVTAGRSARVTPILRDRRGAVVSTSGSDWTWIDFAPGITINAAGRVKTSPTTPAGNYRAAISNAGRTATVTITVR